MRTRNAVLVLVAVISLLAGCVSFPPNPAQARLMSIPPEHAGRYSGDTPLRAAIALADSRESTRLDATLRAALQGSLKTSGLAAPDSGRAPYLLHASIIPVTIERPLFAASTGASHTAHVLYSLVRTVDGKEIFRAEVRTTGSATMRDSIIADNRHEIAFTGAYRKNIAQLVERLYQASLPP